MLAGRRFEAMGMYGQGELQKVYLKLCIYILLCFLIAYLCLPLHWNFIALLFA